MKKILNKIKSLFKKIIGKIKSFFRIQKIEYTPTLHLYYDDKIFDEKMSKQDIEEFVKKEMPFVRIEWIKLN